LSNYGRYNVSQMEARVAAFLTIGISRVNPAAAVGPRKAGPFLAARPVGPHAWNDRMDADSEVLRVNSKRNLSKRSDLLYPLWAPEIAHSFGADSVLLLRAHGMVIFPLHTGLFERSARVAWLS
jgi:hypothetical protein